MFIGSRMMMSTISRSYATWNSADKSPNISLSGSNLIATNSATSYDNVRGTLGKSSGKWYWEITINSTGGAAIYLGIANSLASLVANLGSDAHCSVYRNENGYYYDNASGVSYGLSFSAGSKIGIALDASLSTIEFYLNNASQGVKSITNTGGGALFPIIGLYYLNDQITANFGATPFTYTPPTGFNAGLYQ
jgi:hypothetical protein